MTVLYESTHSCLSHVGGVLIFAALLGFSIAFACMASERVGAAAVVCAISVAIAISAVIFFREPHRRVLVTLDNKYSAVDLYDKYEIVKREGDIWTLDEKKILEEDEGE